LAERIDGAGHGLYIAAHDPVDDHCRYHAPLPQYHRGTNSRVTAQIRGAGAAARLPDIIPRTLAYT
jgi:hypothetical protein